jgi:hypothetical protein
MPAEALHFTAFDDTLVALPRSLRCDLTRAHTLAAARLGVMFVDLPYFESIGTTLLLHTLGPALGLQPRPLPFGDLLHQRAPIALGVRLGELSCALRRRRALKEEGERLWALSLGYICHAAVDTALHPLVNRLAATRARKLGESALRQHREVEKYRSVLFHEERHGCDYLGRPALRDFLWLDDSPLWRPGPIADAVQAAMWECLGAAPTQRQLREYGRGYQRYTALLGGALGRRAITPEEKERERGALYDDIAFENRYAAAVARSVAWVTTLQAYLESGDDASALLAAIPEQSLDPAPEPLRAPLLPESLLGASRQAS